MIPPGPVPEGTALAGVKEAETVLVTFAGKEEESGIERPVEPKVPLNAEVSERGAEVAEKLAELESTALDDATELGTDAEATLDGNPLALTEVGDADTEDRSLEVIGSEGTSELVAANTLKVHVCAMKTSAVSAVRRFTNMAWADLAC